ncbi:MAG: metallophosphatase [Prevotella sp.]|nr:metallophosphatase [Prevotella sp.]
MKLKNILVAALCLFATMANAQEELVIISTNDTHSTIVPLSSNLEDTLKAGRGGYIRRIALLEEQRSQHPGLLLFDSGDFSQGSPYYTLFKGEVEMKLMNMMKYDAVGIGNHEFDFGLDNIARLVKMSDFPWVCANLDFAGTVLEGLIQPYTVIERGDVKIGVFGLTPQLEGLVAAENIGGVVYNDPIESAINVVGQLRETERCDVVVCLSHLGWDMAPIVDDSTLVAKTTGIDIVLGAHSHDYFIDLQYVKNAEGKEVPVDQNGKHGIYIGKTTLAIQNRK